MSQPLKCFMTGSRVFGYATKDSDLDLVVLCDDELQRELIKVVDGFERLAGLPTKVPSSPYYAGRVNFIIVRDEVEFEAWWRARERCLAEPYITRARAIEIHEACGTAAFGASPLKEEQ
jgi:predicted nucleotidyltransferase